MFSCEFWKILITPKQKWTAAFETMFIWIQLDNFPNSNLMTSITFAHRIGNAYTVKILNFIGISRPELITPARSFIKRQTSGISSDNEWQRVTTSGTTSDNEWHQMTTSDNEWKRVTTSGAKSDEEWQRVIQRVTTSDNKKQWVTASDSSIQPMKTAHYTSKNGWLPFFQWQKLMHYYFKVWMAAIRVVK